MFRAVAVLVLTAMAISEVDALVLISQDFDDTGVFVAGSHLDLGGVGDSGTRAGLWRNAGYPDKTGAKVEDVEHYSMGQSLEVMRTEGYETGRFLGYVDGGATSGILEVSFRAKRSAAGPGTEYNGSGSVFAVGNFGVGGPAPLDVMFGDYAIGLNLKSDNNLYVRDGNVDVPAVTSLDTAGGAGSWHEYKLVIDIDNATYDAYLDSAPIYSGAVFDPVFIRNTASGREINAVTATTPFVNGAYSVWFDDIVLVDTSGPHVCGDPDTVYDEFDFNRDCHVNLADVAVFAAQWLWCTDPENSRCDQFWK